MIDVFVSRPTWIDKRFEPGLRVFLARLADAQLNPRTLGASEYPLSAPLDEVLTIINECRGAVVLGFPQIVATAGAIKDATIQSHLVLGTEWNHIEASLAYARKLPLLIVHHEGVTRGIFDRGVLSGYVYACDFSTTTWCHDRAIDGALATWKARVAAFQPSGAQGRFQAPSGSAACPNCSTPDRPFFMSKIPAALGALEDATHLCSRCQGSFRIS